MCHLSTYSYLNIIIFTNIIKKLDEVRVVTSHKMTKLKFHFVNAGENISGFSLPAQTHTGP